MGLSRFLAAVLLLAVSHAASPAEPWPAKGKEILRTSCAEVLRGVGTPERYIGSFCPCFADELASRVTWEEFKKGLETSDPKLDEKGNESADVCAKRLKERSERSLEI